MVEKIKNFYDLDAWEKAHNLFDASENILKLINGLIRSIEKQR